MGRIKKLLDREFVGGSTDEEVYPISSTKAIYDTSNTSLDFILTDYLDKINKLSSKVGFYVCDSLSSDPDKEIKVPNFSLDTNIRLIVKMTRANSADNVSFEVNDTGAKLLYYNDELASSQNTWKENETIDIYYDGTAYRAFHYNASIEGEITDSLWTVKEDENGNKYLYTGLDIVVRGGCTFYSGDTIKVDSIYSGLPIDNDTIYWQEYDNGVKILKAKGGGEGSTFNSTEMWRLLGAPSVEQINSTHLSTALQPYATTNSVNQAISEVTRNFVTINTEQEISAAKHFLQGLSVGANKHKLYEKDGVVYFDGDLAVTGGITQYATDGVSVSTIMDGVTADEVTITKGSDNVLRIKNAGSGSSFDKAAMWAALAANTTEPIHKSHLTTALQGYATESWANSNFLGKTETASNSNKLQNLTWSDFFSRRYHYIDYGAQSTSNFYPIFFFPSDIELDCEIHSDSVSAADAYNQNRIHFQITAQGWSDTGVSFRILSRNNYNDTEITIGAIGCGNKDGGIAIWVRGGKRYRLYCNKTPNMKTSDFTYGSNGEKYTVGTNLDGGTNSFVNIIWKNDLNRNNSLVAAVDGNVYSATKLQNTRTIWGQNFNGERNVNGDLREVNNIYTNRGTIDARVFGDNPSDNHDGMPWYGFRHNDDNHIAISGYGGIDFYSAAGNTLSLSSNGRTYADSLEAKNDIIISGAGVFTTVNNTILRKVGYTHTDILRWDWDGTYGDHLLFTIPGTNDQSKKLYLSSNKGLYFTGIIEATWDIYGRCFEANYGRNSGELNINLSSFYDKETPVIPHDGYRYLLGWQDHCPQGYITGYAIGSYRVNTNWGSMLFEVCNYEGSRSRLTQMELRGKDNTLWLSGNILAIGGITQYSDQRAKTIIEQISLSLMDIANSPAVRFKWNGWKQKDDGKTHIGGIAQYVQNILPEAIYNSDDVLTMDYATTGYIFAVQTAKHLLSYETKTDKEIKQLKKRVKYLEKQLKKLGYEEIGTLDN